MTGASRGPRSRAWRRLDLATPAPAAPTRPSAAIDAHRREPGRVEGVDEGGTRRTEVQGVCPATVAAHHARDWEAGHRLIALAGVDDRLGQEPAGDQVVGPDLISADVRGWVVDQ